MAEPIKKITIKAHYDAMRGTVIMVAGCIMEMRAIGWRVDLKPRTDIDVIRGEFPVDLFTPGGKQVIPRNNFLEAVH